MTELRQRMLDAMVQRGFALRTQESLRAGHSTHGQVLPA